MGRRGATCRRARRPAVRRHSNLHRAMLGAAVRCCPCPGAPGVVVPRPGPWLGTLQLQTLVRQLLAQRLDGTGRLMPGVLQLVLEGSELDVRGNHIMCAGAGMILRCGCRGYRCNTHRAPAASRPCRHNIWGSWRACPGTAPQAPGVRLMPVGVQCPLRAGCLLWWQVLVCRYAACMYCTTRAAPSWRSRPLPGEVSGACRLDLCSPARGPNGVRRSGSPEPARMLSCDAPQVEVCVCVRVMSNRRLAQWYDPPNRVYEFDVVTTRRSPCCNSLAAKPCFCFGKNGLVHELRDHPEQVASLNVIHREGRFYAIMGQNKCI